MLLDDVSLYAEHQEICTYGLGYKLTIKRNKDDIVLGYAFAPEVAIGAA